MNDELKQMLPVTADEAAMLHDMGWLRGLGWDRHDECNWFHVISSGRNKDTVLWVDGNPTLETRFITDIESIRREIAEGDRKQRLVENAEELAEALHEIKERFVITHGVAGLASNGKIGDIYQIADAALKKVEG